MCYISLHQALYWKFRIEANSLDAPTPQQYAPLLALNRFYHFIGSECKEFSFSQTWLVNFLKVLFFGEFILFFESSSNLPSECWSFWEKMWTFWRYFKQMILNLQKFTSKWTLKTYTYSPIGKVEILCTQFGSSVLWKVSLFLVHLPCLHPRSVRQALKLPCLSQREIAVIFFLR